MQRNPIGLVEIKGRAKRVRIHNLITRDQWHKLIADLELLPHIRTMIFIAMLLGLRASEILGLRWEDVDLENSTLWVRRSHVGKVVDDTKTEESEQQLPIHEDLALVLKTWREKNTDEEGGDLSVNGWLFGNMATGRPFWRGMLQKDHLVPAGNAVGIPNLGWHDFRHTYRAMMRQEKISLEEQKTLMRHSDIRTTLGYEARHRPRSRAQLTRRLWRCLGGKPSDVCLALLTNYESCFVWREVGIWLKFQRYTYILEGVSQGHCHSTVVISNDSNQPDLVDASLSHSAYCVIKHRVWLPASVDKY